ncbi:MAG TPA: discoidin domain-containing protein, partial [Leptospiraceae bacterium]|nr:discoidin domain-containing protein [Leptospiraceae bacterium]
IILAGCSAGVKIPKSAVSAEIKPESAYKFLNLANGKSLEVKGISTENGALVQQSAYVGSESQRWTLERKGIDEYRLKNVFSKKYLTEENSGTLTQQDSNPSLSQNWNFVPFENNYITIKNVKSQLYLSGNSSAKDNLPFQLLKSEEKEIQFWKMETVPVQKPVVFKVLLIIKKKTDLNPPYVSKPYRAEMDQEYINAAKISFMEHTPYWVDKLTEGRMKWEPETVVSEEPLTRLARSVKKDDGWKVPSAEDMEDEIRKYAVKGKYDIIFLNYYIDLDKGGGGTAYGTPDIANKTGFAVVNRLYTGELLKKTAGVHDMWIHEGTHCIEMHYLYDRGYKYGIQGGADGGGSHGYPNDTVHGWREFYYNYFKGTVPENGELRGLGERAWAYGNIRDWVINRNTKTMEDILRNDSSFSADLKIPKKDWKIISVDSEEMKNEKTPAVNAIDENPYSFWHTEWSGAKKHPHEIIIDLGKKWNIQGIGYLPRNDGSVNGNIKNYEIYISDSPSSFGSPAAKGIFNPEKKYNTVKFPSVSGRYLKLRSLSEVNGSHFANIAELDTYKD